MAQFSDAILERTIAPKIGSFTQADVPDMSQWDDQSRHWSTNLFLDSALGASYQTAVHAYIFNFLRRAEAAFLYHHQARLSTLAFLSDRSVRSYTRSLLEWEIFVGQSWHGYKLLHGALALPGDPIFRPGDDSVYERLNTIYNAMKHVESRIEMDRSLKEHPCPCGWLTLG